jgi:uncharacterized C2H2 Zn-finger protein
VDLFHKKYKCEVDNEKFNTYLELIEHSRKIHHNTILKCNKCGKQFIHEKDRLHHVREEHGKEMDARVHKTEHTHKNKDKESTQGRVDSKMKNFGDNL